MKLHTKLIVSLIAGLVIVVTAAQTLQYFGIVGRVNRLSDSYQDLLHQREISHARDIYTSVEGAVAGSLKRGEMTKFTHYLEEQKNIQGLLEFSLFNRDGVVTHSSGSEFIDKKLTGDMRSKVLATPDMVLTETDESIEIYQPQLITWDCVRCHTTWKQGDIGGVTYFRFSTDALRSARDEAESAIGTLKAETLLNALGTMAAIVALLVVSMYMLLKKMIGAPLGQFGTLLAKFDRDEGDLTRRIDIHTRDEIGFLAQLFNAFIERLNRVIARAQRAATVVGEKAAAQASTIEETSSAVKDIAEVSRKNSQNADMARNLIQELTVEIDGAMEKMSTLNNAMQDLSEGGREIAAIVKTIDEIAFQTNLLSLNAAVEAAHAGSSGDGFAVVAGEVRSLAQRVAESSRIITSLIDNTVEKIGEGSTLVNETDRVFTRASDTTRRVTVLVEEIAELSARQSSGIVNVNEALSQIERSIQQNAVEADELTDTMSIFKTTDTTRSVETNNKRRLIKA